MKDEWRGALVQGPSPRNAPRPSAARALPWASCARWDSPSALTLAAESAPRTSSRLASPTMQCAAFGRRRWWTAPFLRLVRNPSAVSVAWLTRGVLSMDACRRRTSQCGSFQGAPRRRRRVSHHRRHGSATARPLLRQRWRRDYHAGRHLRRLQVSVLFFTIAAHPVGPRAQRSGRPFLLTVAPSGASASAAPSRSAPQW